MNSLNPETFLIKSSHQSYKLGRKQKVKEASQHYRPGIDLANDLSTSLTEISMVRKKDMSPRRIYLSSTRARASLTVNRFPWILRFPWQKASGSWSLYVGKHISRCSKVFKQSERILFLERDKKRNKAKRKALTIYFLLSSVEHKKLQCRLLLEQLLWLPLNWLILRQKQT